MAALGGVLADLGGLPADVKKAFTNLLTYLVPNQRFGPIAHQTKSENFQAYFVNSTTDSSTGEFSILHGMGRTPYLAVPFLPLDNVGARTVPLTVTRLADAQRVYLKTEAGSTSAPFTVLLE